MSAVRIKGSCLCGRVRYEVAGDAQRFYHCHCGRCRKATGTGHASNLFLQPATLTWLAGEQHLRYYKVPEAQRFANQFCANCGSRLPRRPEGSDMVIVPAGSLDDDAPLLPQARIFMASRAAWSCAGDEVPQFEEYQR